jgi:hypothetical protein
MIRGRGVTSADLPRVEVRTRGTVTSGPVVKEVMSLARCFSAEGIVMLFGQGIVGDWMRLLRIRSSVTTPCRSTRHRVLSNGSSQRSARNSLRSTVSAQV